MIEVNGIAHIILTVGQFEACAGFYKKLLPFMGLKKVFDGQDFCYHVGGRTGIGVQRAAAEFAHERINQARPGLHHLCLRARSESDVDKVYEFVTSLGAKIDSAPKPGPWAPGYYSFVFEDPDGARLEINHVPGQGLLAEGKSFDPDVHYA